MSTSAQFEDLDAFKNAMASVRSDITSDVYVIVSHVNDDPTRVDVLKVGTNVEEIAEYLDSKQVMYILARYESTFDMSTTVKFVYFRWLGEEVTKKGKFGVVHGSIQSLFNPYHAFLETGAKEDFDTEKILHGLEETTGKKSKVVEVTEGRQMRGFTSTQLPNREKVAKSGPTVSTGGANIDIADEVVEAVGQVRSDADPVHWLVAEYKDGSPKGPIILTRTGEGDSNEMVECFCEDKPMYALFRTTDVVDEITTVKFVYIIWVGNGVKPMTKAKISTHKGTAEQLFGPFHVAIFATDLSEVSEKVIMEKVTTASGSKSHVK